MLSSRGAVTNSQVMVECTASQDGRDVFLLSELERVWDAVAAVVRHHLIDGYNVRVAHFCTFWFESRPVVADGAERFSARRLRLGVDANFARRYNLDTSKVPLEPTRLDCVLVPMADIVARSAVAARTASMALREFFSYIGEGLFRGQVFCLDFAGVGRLLIKCERAQFDDDAALRRDIFAIDARRWPLAVRSAAESVVFAAERPNTSQSAASLSRPSTRRSASLAASAIEPRPAFVSAAPRNRLFAEIAKEPPRKMPPRAERCNSDEEKMNESVLPYCIAGDAAAVGECVFDALGTNTYARGEPEIECVEELVPAWRPTLRAYEEEPPRPVPRASFHSHSSVRDLLYGKSAVATKSDSLTNCRRRYINRDSDQVAALMRDTQIVKRE